MADKSGTFTGRSQYSLVITVNQGSQSIPNNTSNVSVSLRIVENTEWGSWSNGTLSWSYNVGGQTGSGTRSGYDFRNYNSLTLYSGTKTIQHNSDGKKSITFSASAGGGTVIGSASTGNGSLTLTTIPRSSTASVPSGTIYAGTSITVSTNRAATSFTHTLTYTFGSASGTIGTSVGASTTWAIPVSLTNQIPNSTTGSGVITTKTYSGSTHVGTTTTPFTLTAPTSAVPTWTSVSVSEGVSDVSTKVGAYVQGKTRLNYAINGASGVYGSTITSRRTTVDGVAYSGISGTMGIPISSSGTVPVTYEITDSRGRKKTQTSNITVLPYEKPKITSYSADRALSNGTIDPDNGTYLRVTLNASVSSLISGSQKNSIAIRVYTRVSGIGSYTLKHTITPSGTGYNSGFTVTGPFDIDKSYDVRVDVTDIFDTSVSLKSLAVASVFMHWGDGLGIGKYHEDGMLDVNGDIYENGKQVPGLVSATSWNRQDRRAVFLIGNSSGLDAPPGSSGSLCGIYINKGVSNGITLGGIQRVWDSKGNDWVRENSTGGFNWSAWRPVSSGVASGRATPSAISPGGTGSVTVTFPVGRFSSPPDVTVSPQTTLPANRPCSVYNVTTTSMTLYQANLSSSSGAVTMHWTATQT